MRIHAGGPGWTVYQADAGELAGLVGAGDHVITDPPYLGPPEPGGSTHARSKRVEYDMADPAVIAELVRRADSAVIITGSWRRTRGVLALAGEPRRILPIVRTFGQPARHDPWGSDCVLANVYGRRARAGRALRVGWFILPREIRGRKHIAELPPSLGAWLAAGLPPRARVVDPFAGSGGLVVGARRLGVDVVAGDLSEAYCDRIAARLAAEPLALLPEDAAEAVALGM